MPNVTLFLCLLIAPVDTAPRLVSGGEDAAEWAGGALDRDVKHDGAASIRWAHADSPQLTLVAPPADWSAHNAIRFWLHSQVRTGSSFMFILSSENPATDGMDYYMARLTLDFEGWREVVLPRRTMAAARSPLGWDRIDRVFFTATGWDNTPDPRAVVHIDQLELFDIVGPRITDTELFEAIDLSLPGLEAVANTVAAGDVEAAVAALARYLRERPGPHWWFDPRQIDRSIRHNRAAADRTVRGEITQVAIPYTFPNGEIDWFFNPTLVSDLPDNHEWQWQLGRMGFWGELGRTYWATGDETYAQTFVRHLRSWVRGCPRPDDSGNAAGSAWRTIECGIRMAGSWPDAFHRFLSSPSFTDADVALYLKSCIEQARHLRSHPTSGNWLTMEMNGLYTVGAVFPELKEAAEWRRYAIDRLHGELSEQFLPDGAQFELTPGYHQVALGNILALPRLARTVGLDPELPEDYVAKMESAYAFNLYLMTPDRDLPRFNDSWPVNVRGSLAGALRFFPHRDDFRWVATDGNEGAPPVETSHAFPYAGYYVMRSGWELDANYLCFDAGPLGYGHVHQDKLNVVLWCYGRQVLFDGGGGSYERSRQRAYGTDTFSHNTVLVDGRPQRRDPRDMTNRVAREPVPARWITTATYDYVAGSYDQGYGAPDRRLAVHTRRILFAKPEVFIIADTLVPADAATHTYQARWHLAPTAVTEALGGVVVSTAPGQPNLAVAPLLGDGLEVRTACAQTEPELLGWWIDKDTDPQYRPATTVLHTRSGAGPQHFVTLLLPLREGEANPLAFITETDLLSFEVKLVDGRRWSIRVDADPAGGIEFAESGSGGAAGRHILAPQAAAPSAYEGPPLTDRRAPCRRGTLSSQAATRSAPRTNRRPG